MIFVSSAFLSMVSVICVAIGAAVDTSWLYPPDCNPQPRMTNHSLEVDSGDLWSAQSHKLFDRFGALRSDDEKARLDNFVVELQANPGATGYIIVFYQRGKNPSQAKKRADNVKDYLNYYRELDDSRIVSWYHCARAKVEYELWLVYNTKDFDARYKKGCTPPPARRIIRR